MRDSIGLAAYRTLSARRTVPELAPFDPRPEGEMVWIHAAEEGNNKAIADLARRLVTVRHGTHVIVTAAHGTFDEDSLEGVHIVDAPDDHPETAMAFVDHWRPDVMLWAWGGLQPNLILEAEKRGTYLLLVDADSDGFDGRRERWLPEVTRRLLNAFDRVIARSDETRDKFVNMGHPADAIEVAAPLRPSSRMLPANDSDIADLTEAFAGRPSWLAASAVRAEARILLGAQKLVVGTSPRLLLILLARSPADAAHAMNLAQTAGMRAVYWGDGTLPDDTCQVLVADAADELGLWMRMAPVTFMGGSLQAGRDVFDPYIAASHGTALIYGPNVGAHDDAFRHLFKARAARLVKDKTTLVDAVSQMVAPDRAAQMAMAGWDLMTQAALSLDRVADLTQSHLDAIEGGGS
ncbi:MAG: glycosyltransferase N-terminal domain-containing protein [Pseudomonadota bacterium]